MERRIEDVVREYDELWNSLVGTLMERLDAGEKDLGRVVRALDVQMFRNAGDYFVQAHAERPPLLFAQPVGGMDPEDFFLATTNMSFE